MAGTFHDTGYLHPGEPADTIWDMLKVDQNRAGRVLGWSSTECISFPGRLAGLELTVLIVGDETGIPGAAEGSMNQTV